MYVLVEGKATNAAGVAILMHARHTKWAKRNVALSEGALYVDVQIGKNKIRIIAAFAPHAGYSEQDFASIFEKLYSPLHGAYKAGRHVIFGGDSNFQTDVGKHGAQFASLCSGFGLNFFSSPQTMMITYVSPWRTRGLSAAPWP